MGRTIKPTAVPLGQVGRVGRSDEPDLDGETASVPLSLSRDKERTTSSWIIKCDHKGRMVLVDSQQSLVTVSLYWNIVSRFFLMSSKMARYQVQVSSPVSILDAG